MRLHIATEVNTKKVVPDPTFCCDPTFWFLLSKCHSYLTLLIPVANVNDFLLLTTRIIVSINPACLTRSLCPERLAI